MSKTIAIALMFGGTLIANPCDGNPRVGASGSAFSCSLTAPVIMDSAAIDPNCHQTLNLVLTASTTGDTVFSVIVRYKTESGSSQVSTIVRRSAMGANGCRGCWTQFAGSKTATTINLPMDAVIDSVQVDEFIPATTVSAQ